MVFATVIGPVPEFDAITTIPRSREPNYRSRAIAKFSVVGFVVPMLVGPMLVGHSLGNDGERLAEFRCRASFDTLDYFWFLAERAKVRVAS